MLRSGNGQHRRPRQAPAFVVTAGATGAGIALPLLAATGAHAATTSTWDKVAQCESGGLWSENSGNGFFGGLQLTLSAWEQYGGTAYAERPDLASRQQQIAVAERALQGQGPALWQDCTVDAGLSQGGPAPAVDPGGPGSAAAAPAGRPQSGLSDTSQGAAAAAPAAGGTPAAGAASPSAGQPSAGLPSAGLPSASAPAGSAASAPPAASAAPGASATAIPTPPSGSPSDPLSAAPTGTAAAPTGTAATASGAAAPTDGSAGAAAAPSRGRHAKPVADVAGSVAPVQGDAGVVASATGSLDPLPAVAGSTVPGVGSYTVRAGDSLSQIAADRTPSGDWVTLYAANKSTIGSNPDLIRPGQHLTLG